MSARDRARATAAVRELGAEVPVVPIGELEPLADLVVECAPAPLLAEIAAPFLRAGKEVVVLSVGALLEQGLATKAAKRLIDDGLTMELETGLTVEQQVLSQLFAGQDAKEGINAFIDKRDPSWEDR